MNRRVVFGMVGWLTVAAAATGAGVAAIGVLEDGITGSEVRPLDRDAVRRSLSRTGVPTASSTTRALPATAPADEGITRVLAAGGGTVTARCGGGQATLVEWTPAQGYRAEELVRGPATTASLKFESDSLEYEVTVTCQAGEPRVRTRSDDGHHGRGRHGD